MDNPLITPHTLVTLALLAAAALSLVLWLLRQGYARHIGGLRAWNGACLLWLVAMPLYLGRGMAPLWLSMALANALLVGGAIVYYLGTRQFMGHAAPWRGWAVAWLAYSAALLALTAARTPRIALLIALGLLVVQATHLVFVWCHGNRRPSTALVLLGLAFSVLVMLYRVLEYWRGGIAQDLFDASTAQYLYLAAFAVFTLMFSLGMVLMASDRLREELEHLAGHDGLTGVLNRAALLDAAERAMQRSRRERKPLALLMVDIDDFKALNEQHGQAHGDAVLQHLARSVASVLRSTDSLGRYGGAQFVVLLPDSDQPQALAVAERIQDVLAQGHALDCPVSIGLASCHAGQETLDALLTRAEAVLMHAKAHRRTPPQAAPSKPL